MVSKRLVRMSEVNRMRQLREDGGSYEGIARMTDRAIKTVKRYTKDVVQKPKERWSPLHKQMQEMRREGYTVRQIADITERSEVTVTNAVKHIPPTTQHPYAKIDKKRLISMKELGYSNGEIARIFGCSKVAVGQVLKRMQRDGYKVKSVSLYDVWPTDRHASS
jgi:transposase